MPIVVHLADERDASTIRRNGLKIGKNRQGIFCMPVLPNFYVSHQWLRELKRSGAKTFVGVYFRLASGTLVYAGKYNEPHRQVSLGTAIQEIMNADDPLGYELIIDRKVEAGEIQKIRALPQKMGWRYSPESHLEKPVCACPVCIPSGSIKGKRLRDKIELPTKEPGYDELISRLKIANKEDEIDNLLWAIRRTKRRADPTDLAFLLERHSESVDQSVALTLGAYKHTNTKSLLFGLLKREGEDTREFATDSLLNLYGQNVFPSLMALNDGTVNRVTGEWSVEKPI